MLHRAKKQPIAVMSSAILALTLSVGAVQAADYQASTKEGPIKIINLDELEDQVAKNMEKGLLAIFVVGPKMS